MRKLLTSTPVTFIAPFEDMALVANQCFASLDDKISVRIGDLQAGVDAALEAVAAGSEVIISRGGTAELIARSVSIPVIPVRVTGYDVLRAVMAAFERSSNVGVVGFDSVVAGCRTIAAGLGREIAYASVESEADVIPALRLVMEKGVSIVVGDKIATTMAGVMGLPFILVQSGLESIMQAYEEASQLLIHVRKQRRHNTILQALLDYSDDAVVAVDAQGTIQFANEAAGRIYGVSRGFDTHGGDVGSVSEFSSLSHLKAILNGAPQVSAELVNIDSYSMIRNTVAMKSGNEIIGAMEISHDVTRLRALERRIGNQVRKSGFFARHCLDDLIGGSEAIGAVKKLAAVVGRDDCNVLIIGETGTGKELMAQGIHSSSNDPTRPFVAVNCAAIPGSLLESELFGYADGAFTGARKGGRPGLFELANGGTLFLDEIGEMNLEAQARLLRVLQDRMVRRIGEERMIPVYVRVIAASNVDLHEGVEKGRFRRDLLYRLNVAEILIPPLRERREDIAELIAYLVDEISRRKAHMVEPMNAELIRLAEELPWYGNVRELRNFCERYVMFAGAGFSGDTLRRALLPKSGTGDLETESGIDLTLRDLIRREVRHTYLRCGENVSETARCLDVDRATVRKYLD